MKSLFPLILAIFAIGLCTIDAAESAEASTEENKSEKPKTAVVEKGEVEVSVDFEGLILPVEGETVFFDPKAWTSFKVIDALDHGSTVKKGDSVIKVDLEDLEQAIVDQKASVEKLHTQLHESEIRLERLKRNQEIALDKAEQAFARKEEDHRRFLDISVPIKRRDAEFALDVAKRQLANEEEELKQLTAMYVEDELTEETEEIILTRQKNRVNDVRYRLEKQELATENALEITIPREIEDDMKALENSRLYFEDMKLNQEFETEKELQKHATLKLQLERAEQRLKDLLEDKENASFTAPANGTIFYGMIDTNGQWDHSDAHKSLVRGGSLVAMKALFSVIEKNQELQLVARVDPAKAAKLRLGLEGHAVVEGSKALRTPIHQFSLSSTSGIDGKYLVHAELKPADFLVPNLKVKVTASGMLDGTNLKVPTGAVQTDKDGSLKVEVQNEDGTFEERMIQITAEGIKALAVKEGLNAGDIVKLHE